MIKVQLPDLGEENSQATVSYWYFEEGATVREGEDLVEMATEKATFNVPAPCSGAIVEILAHEGDTVESGAVLAMMEEDDVMEEEGKEEEY